MIDTDGKTWVRRVRGGKPGRWHRIVSEADSGFGVRCGRDLEEKKGSTLEVQRTPASVERCEDCSFVASAGRQA